MDACDIPHGLSPEEWAELTAEERLAMLLVYETRPDAVRERALQVFEEWRRRGPA
ncbi:hypothetical protein AB0B45_02735 [Nonomuraea sp. NPDC049152]|uniref:hypothetical protein n=1 Tax=Nonomuraea sp. NPDC049152 TaxID=3154350 RepID=UPI0033F4E8AA